MFLFVSSGLTGTKTRTDQSAQLHFIGSTQHASDRSIHHQVYTDLKFIGKLQLITIQLRLKCYDGSSDPKEAVWFR